MRQRINISEKASQKILWFDNHHLNYGVMKTYYPRFYDKIVEMQAILFAQGYMLDEIEMAIEVILNNMFIVHMDEDSVSILEKFLSITPLLYQTLEDRKNVLLSHFRGNGSISMSFLEAVVEAICKGDCNGTLKTVDELSSRGVSFVITNSDIRDSLKDVIAAIMRHIPAHLWFEILYEPIKIISNCKEILTSSTSIENFATTAGDRREYIINNSVSIISSSTSVENVAVVAIPIYDGGSLSDNIEDIIDGGTLTAAPDNIIVF